MACGLLAVTSSLLAHWQTARPTAPTGVDVKGGLTRGGSGGGLWGSLAALFGGGGGGGGGGSMEPQLEGVSTPRGIYMYGGVGCGESAG